MCIVSTLFFIVGIVLGSFGNVLIIRLPVCKSIRGRSECPLCHHPLSLVELIPILSYIFLRGRCKHCSAPISIIYPLVELASGLLFLVAAITELSLLTAAFLALALWLLLLITIVDARTKGIPDIFNFPLLLVGVAYSSVAGTNPLSGILMGAGFFAVQWLLSFGRWVGSGDIILAAGIGALLGTWQMTLVMLFFAYVLGALIASVLLLTGKVNRKSHLAFGPFLALGAVLTLLFGEPMITVMQYGI